MDWQPYQDCCRTSAAALDSDASFCPECGHDLMRCVAFSECRSLVTPTQPCPACVAPVLMLDAGAVVRGNAGERMSVKLVLFNASPASRPLWVKRIVKRDVKGEQQLTIDWDRLDAKAEVPFFLKTDPLVEGGIYTLDVLLVLATRYKAIEEEYAFTASVTVRVAPSLAGPSTVKLIVKGKAKGTGAGHNVNARIGGDPTTEGPAAALANREVVPLQRAERYELEQGIRGYRKEGLRVLRHVEFSFSGFRSDDTPKPGNALIPRGRLLFGRNSRTPNATTSGTPNDVCLRAFDTQGAKVDEPATMAISRHHFELAVINDRLCLQARATSGMQVNGDDVTSGQVVPLAPGDSIVPIPGRPEKMTLRVGFTNAIGLVERIDVSRTPALTRNT